MIVAAQSAAAEATRLEAMRCLADGSEHCICEFMRKLGATPSRMSRHLHVLKQAGLVVDRQDAQWVRYQIDPGLSPSVVGLLEAALESSVSAGDSAA